MNLQQQIINLLADGPLSYYEISHRGRTQSTAFYGINFVYEMINLRQNGLIETIPNDIETYNSSRDPIYQLAMPIDQIEKLLLLC